MTLKSSFSAPCVGVDFEVLLGLILVEPFEGFPKCHVYILKSYLKGLDEVTRRGGGGVASYHHPVAKKPSGLTVVFVLLFRGENLSSSHTVGPF